MSAPAKKRLDILVFERKLAPSRQKASALIMTGNILVNNELADKPGAMVPVDAEIVNKGADLPLVSRGGYKIDHAIKTLSLDISGMTCLDVGASTGGFTDCLLQHGAARVYAVDVGYGQLDWKLRQDSRVVVIERTNIRYADKSLFPELFDLITIDVSFISLKIVIPAVTPLLKSPGRILALIKPQFEVGRGQVGKGGVVRNDADRNEAVESVAQGAVSLGLSERGRADSVLAGPKGNREIFLWLERARG